MMSKTSVLIAIVATCSIVVVSTCSDYSGARLRKRWPDDLLWTVERAAISEDRRIVISDICIGIPSEWKEERPRLPQFFKQFAMFGDEVDASNVTDIHSRFVVIDLVRARELGVTIAVRGAEFEPIGENLAIYPGMYDKFACEESGPNPIYSGQMMTATWEEPLDIDMWQFSALVRKGDADALFMFADGPRSTMNRALGVVQAVLETLSLDT